jgi:hypothetical protein
MFNLDENSSTELLIKVTNINSIYNIMVKKKELFVKQID